MTGPTFSYDYVAIGHVTRDVIEDAPGGPAEQPGGGAFYSALQAARLGLRTKILTRGVPAEIQELLAPYTGELDLQVEPAEQTTTLATRGSRSSRTQRVLAWAGPIEAPGDLDARIVHLAPVARETPARLGGDPKFVGITPQGWVRSWLGIGSELMLAELEADRLPQAFQAAVVSESERALCGALFSSAERIGALVAVTAGARSTTVHLPVTQATPLVTPVPPPLEVRDDLGAGDAFAAAFFVALEEGEPALSAATFANLAATVRVSGSGADALASRGDIERLLRDSEQSPEDSQPS